jgi:hypothetical protein
MFKDDVVKAYTLLLHSYKRLTWVTFESSTIGVHVKVVPTRVPL